MYDTNEIRGNVHRCRCDLHCLLGIRGAYIGSGRLKTEMGAFEQLPDQAAEDYVVWGSGNQARSFIYISDIIRALLMVTKHGMNQGPIQIGNPDQVSIAEIAKKIAKISRKPIDICFDTSKPEGDIGRVGDCSKARRILDWTPAIDLDTGLSLTYQWIDQEINP